MKVGGNKFIPIKKEESRIIISYNCIKVSENFYTWNEIYLFNKNLNIDIVKKYIIDDIDNETTATIINGFIWNNIPVWLSTENQFNFKAAYDLAFQTNGASLPVTFKIGQTPKNYNEEGKEQGEEPIYHTFETLEDISDFYTKAFDYINMCLNEGWQRKDSIDWEKYKEYFTEPEEPVTEQS